jgi:hypothetical protein
MKRKDGVAVVMGKSNVGILGREVVCCNFTFQEKC